jgi:hypothetical protein
LEGRVDALAIPEVNALFERPASASPLSPWYFERQVDRMRMAVEEAERHSLVLLDGDPFQPLWYNWAYRFEGWQPLAEMRAFYGSHIRAGRMRFPDRYVILQAGEADLRRRKEGDATRSRRNFESHLPLNSVVGRYFEAMSRTRPDWVRMVQATTIEDNVRAVLDATQGRPPDHGADVVLFESLIGWLGDNEPDVSSERGS